MEPLLQTLVVKYLIWAYYEYFHKEGLTEGLRNLKIANPPEV